MDDLIGGAAQIYVFALFLCVATALLCGAFLLAVFMARKVVAVIAPPARHRNPYA